MCCKLGSILLTKTLPPPRLIEPTPGTRHELQNGDIFVQKAPAATVPGWTHDITNIGAEEMIVMLWANEVFDRERPDTFAAAV